MPHGTFPRGRPCILAAAAKKASVCLGLGLLGGCTLLTSQPREVAPAMVAPISVPDPRAPRLAPLETRHFVLADGKQEIVGETQILFTRYENTFSSIGRQYDLGYEELRHANPTVDQWLPGEATPVFLPTQTILPAAPRKGIVVNVPAMRLFYFTTEPAKAAAGAPAVEAVAARTKQGEPAAPAVVKVTTHPIGIGAEGWATPIGEAKVTQKARDPVWYVPASVRKEHAERGDPLPSVVQPGPDNPLGSFAMSLSIPGYLIHGTNKPAGVGMRSSHGCIRLYPEDIEELFDRVAKGTPVRIVNQPVLAGWRDGMLYLEVHRPLAEDTRDLVAEADAEIKKALERAGHAPVEIDRAAVQRIASEQRGIPFPVLRTNRSLEQYLAAARIVENIVPAEAAEKTAAADESASSAREPSKP
jgi:L,D-transpeptidase ErfK/SrfK